MDKKNEKNASGEAFVKYLRLGIIALVALAVVGVGLIIAPSIIKTKVATIGSEPVYDYELKYFLEQQKNTAYAEAQKENPNLSKDQFLKTPINGQNVVDAAKKSAMEKIQEIKIQVTKAKQKGIKLEKTDLDYINSLFSQFIQSKGTEEAANKEYVATYGITLNQFKEIYKEIALSGKFAQNEQTNLKVTAADIKNYYDKNPDKYIKFDYRADGGEAVWARHILIQVASGATAADKDAAKKKAQDILDRANKGEDFLKLIKENSEDPGSKDRGGDYVFGKGVMDPPFEAAAFALNPGQISGLVEGASGYHIIKLEEKYAKDQPVSLKCAQEYANFGVDYVKGNEYQASLAGWKKDAAFGIKYNKGAYDSIK